MSVEEHIDRPRLALARTLSNITMNAYCCRGSVADTDHGMLAIAANTRLHVLVNRLRELKGVRSPTDHRLACVETASTMITGRSHREDFGIQVDFVRAANFHIYFGRCIVMHKKISIEKTQSKAGECGLAGSSNPTNQDMVRIKGRTRRQLTHRGRPNRS